MSKFEVTYKLADSAPPPMAWDEYAEVANRQWEELLSGNPSELSIHTFLERNPSFVPGSDAPALGWGSRGQGDNILYTRPPLPGLEAAIPDFLWICRNSGELIPVMIEIKDPSKKWFTKRQPHHDLTQALTQLRKWKTWFEEFRNRATFHDLFGIDDRWRKLPFRPRFVLVYGHSSEFVDSTLLTNMRGQLAQPDEALMTFSRLGPASGARDTITARIKRGRISVVSIPPTYRVGALQAEELIRILDAEEAVPAMELTSAERRRFLQERIPYWRQWIKDNPFRIQGKAWE